MSFSSISDVGKEIVSILNKALIPDVLMHTGSIGLCSPQDHGDYAVGVYLYDVSLNTDIIQSGMINTGRNQQTYPSTYLSLHYMITAYSSGDLKFRSEEDHRLLGKIVQALSDNAVIGRTGSLNGKPMKTIIEMERLEPYDKLRLWTFPNEPYRLSLFFRVQPVEISSAKTKPVKRVRDIQILIGDQTIFSEGQKSAAESGGEDSVSYSTVVALCIDKETGRPVTAANARAYIEGMKAPVIKEDGYRIFLNVPQKEPFTIHCESRIYEPQEVVIDPTETDVSEVIEIALAPGPYYPRPDIADE